MEQHRLVNRLVRVMLTCRWVVRGRRRCPVKSPFVSLATRSVDIKTRDWINYFRCSLFSLFQQHERTILRHVRSQGDHEPAIFLSLFLSFLESRRLRERFSMASSSNKVTSSSLLLVQAWPFFSWRPLPGQLEFSSGRKYKKRKGSRPLPTELTRFVPNFTD